MRLEYFQKYAEGGISNFIPDLTKFTNIPGYEGNTQPAYYQIDRPSSDW